MSAYITPELMNTLLLMVHLPRKVHNDNGGRILKELFNTSICTLIGQLPGLVSQRTDIYIGLVVMFIAINQGMVYKTLSDCIDFWNDNPITYFIIKEYYFSIN